MTAEVEKTRMGFNEANEGPSLLMEIMVEIVLKRVSIAQFEIKKVKGKLSDQ